MISMGWKHCEEKKYFIEFIWNEADSFTSDLITSKHFTNWVIIEDAKYSEYDV